MTERPEDCSRKLRNERCWQNAASIKRDFPYAVELEVPPSGFGTRLDRIYGFHVRVGVDPRRGRGRREGERGIACWRFADADTAQAFADEFGGLIPSQPSMGTKRT
jgi:hypothetical protein